MSRSIFRYGSTILWSTVRLSGPLAMTQRRLFDTARNAQVDGRVLDETDTNLNVAGQTPYSSGMGISVASWEVWHPGGEQRACLQRNCSWSFNFNQVRVSGSPLSMCDAPRNIEQLSHVELSDYLFADDEGVSRGRVQLDVPVMLPPSCVFNVVLTFGQDADAIRFPPDQQPMIRFYLHGKLHQSVEIG